jgi:hypothetical protein
MSEGDFWISVLLFVSVQVVACLCLIPILKINAVDKTKSKLNYRASIIAIFSVFFAINSFINFEIVTFLYRKEPELFDTLVICLFYSLIVFALSFFIVESRENKDPSEHLRSYKKDNSAFSKAVFRNVKEIKNKDISTYPRLTISELNSNTPNEKEIIFDSSDFEYINKTFKLTEEHYFSLNKGETITYENIDYYIEDVKVDFLYIFDDYSLFGHSKKYQGIGTPYNIQIIVLVSKI